MTGVGGTADEILEINSRGVRMLHREFTFEEKLGAVVEYRKSGKLRETGRRLGIGYENIRRWNALYESGLLYNAGRRKVRQVKGVSMDEENKLSDELPDSPEELKRIIRDQQLEIDLMKAVVEVVKKDPRVDPSTLSNREKTMVIDALRPTYSLNCLASRLAIPLSSYHYHHAVLARGDKYADLRAKIRSICEEHRLTWGYRRVKLELQYGPEQENRSEKVVLRLMSEMGLLAVVPKAAGYSSYSKEADVSEVPNLLLREDETHDFFAKTPNELWLSDVTQFCIPAGRTYLSPILDAFDGKLVSWQIARNAKSSQLTDPSLKKACKTLGQGEHPIIHTDRGAQYHARTWIKICTENCIVRSMSRKGYSPDNARMEGFFGLLKREFFYCRDWSGVSLDEFEEELDAWLHWYNEARRTIRLGWMSPMQYRRSLGLAA